MMAKVQIDTPLTLASGHVVNNRIAKVGKCFCSCNNRVQAALTECIADPSTNRVNERHVRLYKHWGETKAGIIMTGNIMVDRRYLEAPPNVVIDDERDLEILKKLVKECQANGLISALALIH